VPLYGFEAAVASDPSSSIRKVSTVMLLPPLEIVVEAFTVDAIKLFPFVPEIVKYAASSPFAPVPVAGVMVTSFATP